MIQVADEDAVLELADAVMAEVQLEQPVAEQRMFDGRPEFPGPLRLQVRVAAVDTVGR